MNFSFKFNIQREKSKAFFEQFTTFGQYRVTQFGWLWFFVQINDYRNTPK